MNIKQTILAVAALAVILALIVPAKDSDAVEVMAEFPGRVVYTTDTTADTAALAADCAARGGTLNTCGSPCAPGAEVCIEVCAFTCELPTNNGWFSYANEDVGFRIERRDEMTVTPYGTEEQQGVAFSLWGPTQVEDTEFYDGIVFGVTRWRLADKTLREFAEEEEVVLMSIGEVTAPLTTIVLAGREGYEFSGVSVGAPQRRIFLPLGNTAALEITVLMDDPTGQGYEADVRRMLESFSPLNPPEANIKVDAPAPGKTLGEQLVIEGYARVFENTVNYRLRDEDGTILAEGFATADAPDTVLFGSFAVSTEYNEPAGTTRPKFTCNSRASVRPVRNT